MPFTLTILGSSSAIPAHGRGLSAQVIQNNNSAYLIDCGEGTQFSLITNKIKLSRIDQVFISHLHGDHVFGLPGLISTMSMQGRRKKLQLFSPPGLAGMIDTCLEMSDTYLNFELEFIILDHKKYKKIFSNQDLSVYTLPLDHRLPACGFKFVEKKERNIDKQLIEPYGLDFQQIRLLKKGQDVFTKKGVLVKSRDVSFLKRPPDSYAYISDTKFKPALAEHNKGVGIIFHEATYLDELEHLAKERKHSTALQAAKIAKSAGAGKLVLGHFSSRYKNLEPLLYEAKSIFPNTFLGVDGSVFRCSE